MFRTRYSYYEYVVILFGLINVFIIFQVNINKALKDFWDIICITFIDDIGIYSNLVEEYVGYVR